jgi:hypothetical protein
MGSGILQFVRRIDACEPAHQIVPEEDLQMGQAVGSRVHEPNPGQDHRGLQCKTHVQLPAKQLAPAPFPQGERDQGQCRYHPGDGAFAKEAHPQRGVHQQVTAQALAGAGRIETPVGAQQCDGYGSEQRRIGRQPDGDLIGQQESADGRGAHQTCGTPDAATRQQAHAQRGDHGIQQIGQPRSPSLRTDESDGNRCQPISQRRLLAEGLAREQGHRLVRLPAHAPGDVRFPRFIGGPVAAPEDTDAPCQEQCRRQQRDGRAERLQQSSILMGQQRRAHGIR